jgi:hypothetical protein
VIFFLYFLYFSFITDDSIDVTNDEEADQPQSQSPHTGVVIPNFAGHSLYGHNQVSMVITQLNRSAEIFISF